MHLGYQLYPLKSKTRRQIITESSKFYFFDTGLANYIRRYEYKEMFGAEAGNSFEHYIFLELISYKNLCEKRDQINYWRTREGYEVDFIVQDHALEVKMSNSINSKHLKELLEFKKDNHNDRLNIICPETRKRITKIDNYEVIIWPVQEFLVLY